MQLLTEWTRDELKELNPDLVVQMWNKKDFGRGRRAWLAAFSEAERKTASEYHRLYYDWTMRKGIPDTCVMRFATYALLCKVRDFFGSL